MVQFFRTKAKRTTVAPMIKMPVHDIFETIQSRFIALRWLLLLVMLAFAPMHLFADEMIPMHDKGANTYYINGNIRGLGPTEFMVDTGSGYMTINQETLDILREKGEATFVKQLTGVLADGQQKIYPVYRIAQIRLGESCILRGVEAAVFPGNTRQILGLSALKQAGKFTFDFSPPQLHLNQCLKTTT